MSTPFVTLDRQDQFDKALSDLGDAIHAAKAMAHVVSLKDDGVRNNAMSVVVLALEKAFSDIEAAWSGIPLPHTRQVGLCQRGPKDPPSQDPGAKAMAGRE